MPCVNNSQKTRVCECCDNSSSLCSGVVWCLFLLRLMIVYCHYKICISSSEDNTLKVILSPFLTRSCVSILCSPQCTVGSQVAMRVGGDFFFDPSPSDPAVDLLLVAGGVGINPLYSILLHTTDLMQLNRSSGGRDYNIGSVHLSYSAKNTQELLFKVRTSENVVLSPPAGLMCLSRMLVFRWVSSYRMSFQSSVVQACREFPDKLSCDFHVTQQSAEVDPYLTPFLSRE